MNDCTPISWSLEDIVQKANRNWKQKFNQQKTDLHTETKYSHNYFMKDESLVQIYKPKILQFPTKKCGILSQIFILNYLQRHATKETKSRIIQFENIFFTYVSASVSQSSQMKQSSRKERTLVTIQKFPKGYTILRDVLMNGDSSTGKLSVSLVANLYEQGLSVLSEMHTFGIFHRNITLQSLWISEDKKHILFNDFYLSCTADCSNEFVESCSNHLIPRPPLFVHPLILAKSNTKQALEMNDIYAFSLCILASIPSLGNSIRKLLIEGRSLTQPYTFFTKIANAIQESLDNFTAYATKQKIYANPNDYATLEKLISALQLSFGFAHMYPVSRVNDMLQNITANLESPTRPAKKQFSLASTSSSRPRTKSQKK